MQSEEFTSIFGSDEKEAVVSSAESARYEMAASVLGVSKKFRDTVVLDDINFDVAEGEAIVLLGASM